MSQVYKDLFLSVFILVLTSVSCTPQPAAQPAYKLQVSPQPTYIIQPTPQSTEGVTYTEIDVPTPVATESAQLELASITLPPQGLYDSCVPTREDCLNHLNILSAKGFKLIVNYGQLYGDSAAQIAYADRAHSLGMKIIWSIVYRDGRPDDWMIEHYQEFSSGLGCNDNFCMIEKFVNLVKAHPATWGYYVADEVRPEAITGMKKWSDLIRSLDPSHPRLYVTAGSNHPMEQYYGFYSNMADLAEVFGPCYYPYGYIETGKKISRQTGETARHAQYWADKLGGRSVMVLQAFSWTRYARTPLCFPWPSCAPFPTYEQMKIQRDQVITNSRPELILWWTYEDILQSDNPEYHLQQLADAAFAPLPDPIVSERTIEAPCFVGWYCEDIGNPRIEGKQVEKNGAWIVEGSGWEIWDKPWVRADQFRFVWKNIEGDVFFQSKVEMMFNPNQFKAGIMFRKSVDPVSPYYAVLIADDSKIHVQVRADYGQESKDLTAIAIRDSKYIKMKREGFFYSAYTSDDGYTWSIIPNSMIDLRALDGELMAGVAVTSKNENLMSTAIFHEVESLDNR